MISLFLKYFSLLFELFDNHFDCRRTVVHQFCSGSTCIVLPTNQINKFQAVIITNLFVFSVEMSIFHEEFVCFDALILQIALSISHFIPINYFFHLQFGISPGVKTVQFSFSQWIDLIFQNETLFFSLIENERSLKNLFKNMSYLKESFSFLVFKLLVKNLNIDLRTHFCFYPIQNQVAFKLAHISKTLLGKITNKQVERIKVEQKRKILQKQRKNTCEITVQDSFMIERDVSGLLQRETTVTLILKNCQKKGFFDFTL